MLAEGVTNQELADRLFISERTANRHLSNIFTKLGVRTRTAAARIAIQAGLSGLANAPSGRMERPTDAAPARRVPSVPRHDEHTFLLDTAAVEAFAGRVLTDFAGAAGTAMTVIGDRLGLYAAMTGAGPTTADRTGRADRAASAPGRRVAGRPGRERLPALRPVHRHLRAARRARHGAFGRRLARVRRRRGRGDRRPVRHPAPSSKARSAATAASTTTPSRTRSRTASSASSAPRTPTSWRSAGSPPSTAWSNGWTTARGWRTWAAATAPRPSSWRAPGRGRSSSGSTSTSRPSPWRGPGPTDEGARQRRVPGGRGGRSRTGPVRGRDVLRRAARSRRPGRARSAGPTSCWPPAGSWSRSSRGRPTGSRTASTTRSRASTTRSRRRCARRRRWRSPAGTASAPAGAPRGACGC